MKRGIIWIVLTCIMVTSLVLASCNKTSTTTTSTSTSTNTSTTTTTKITSTTTAISPTTTKSTTAVTGNWWDSLGTPQYGGEIDMRYVSNITAFDPYLTGGTDVESAWLQRIHCDDWTLDPAIYRYVTNWRPSDYQKGELAKSWEFVDSGTFVVHLRQGIHWQNISPVNGREFTANDITYHFNRLLGIGDGFTVPSPFQTGSPLRDIKSVTATDKYTVVFKWTTPNPEFILETIQGGGLEHCVEAREAVQQWGDVNDWHHAIGTGPFILQDFVSGSSATLIKNPDYWGYDERYPQNKLPYINTLKVLIIPDDATALAGLRSGKIDAIGNISLQQAQDLQKTNPELLQAAAPIPLGITVDPRNDVKPFNDIRVRKAMQMAIDLPTIAKSYYGGSADPYPLSLTAACLTGWGFPYQQWPQDLKDEYAYNPTMAKKLLADAGYPNGFKTNVVANISGDLDLLQIVKSYFANVGIDMEIRTMDNASWTTFVRSGRKHDQIAYTSSTGSLGFTYEPIRQTQRFLITYAANWLNIDDPVFNTFYPKALAAKSVDEVKQVLKDTNEYVARQHFAISLLQPNTYAIYQPWLKGFYGQNHSVAVTMASGVTRIGFYTARFWIDQNLKRNFGQLVSTLGVMLSYKQ